MRMVALSAMFFAAMPTQITIRRILTASALFAFVGVFFVVPLWAVLTMCTMPCCHHSSGPVASLGSAMGCHDTCIVVAADDALATSTLVAPSPHDLSAAAPAVNIAAVVSATPLAVAPEGAPPTRSAGAARYLLNSVFRI